MNRQPEHKLAVVSLSKTLSRALFALWVIGFCLVFASLWFPGLLSWNEPRPEGLLLVLAVATTLASLMRQLPGQTVLLAAFGVGFVGFAWQGLSSLTSIPTGLLQPSQGSAPGSSLSLAFGAALIWIVVILNSRGVAQIILRPRRRSAAYGLWLLGLSVALATILAASLSLLVSRSMQPLAFKAAELSREELVSLGARVLCWSVAALFTLAWIAVILVNKKSDAPMPTLQPLFIWLLSSALMLSRLRAEPLKWAAGVWLVLCGTVAVLAWRARAGGD
jgi:hypothetical protein